MEKGGGGDWEIGHTCHSHMYFRPKKRWFPLEYIINYVIDFDSSLLFTNSAKNLLN